MSLRSWADAQGDITLTCDVVVVGTGPGGAAAARVFAEGGASVVLVEEGPALPVFRPNMTHTMRYHMQEDGMMVARSASMMPIAAGRGVGGGSLINSAITFRAPPIVLDGWKDRLAGDDGFSRANLDPVYDEVAAIIGVGVTSAVISGENNRLIARGAAALGYPGGLAPRNTPHCSGCGLCNTGCPVGGKGSMDKNLLPMAMAKGAIIQADTKVREILVDKGRAIGIRGVVHHQDTREEVGRLTVMAGRVVLSAGAVGTPRLLHGCGLAARLGEHVGKHLHVHPGNAVLGRCDTPVNLWRGATQGAYFEIPGHPGILPHTFSAPPGATLVLLGKVGQDAKKAHELLPYLCGSVVMVSDHGDGTVNVRSDGRADLAYTFADDDVERIKFGMVETAKVLMAGGAKEVMGLVFGVGWHSDVDEFAAALKDRRIEDFGLYASHPMGTCRMASDPAEGVVRGDGRTHGLEGLYVADASIFPTSLGVNPSLTTMALCTALARRMMAAG